MSDVPPETLSVDQMYGPWGPSDDEVDAILDASQSPRPMTSLYDTFGDLGLGPEHIVLDIGARDARHSLELAARYGCRFVAVDPVELNVADARAAVAEHEHGSLVEVRPGVIQDIPAADGEFDGIWSRDMLGHIPDLDRALAECLRVVKPGGPIVVYETFATELMEPAEAARIYADLATVPDRMSAAGFEAAVEAAGLDIALIDVIGSEWREAWEEDGSRRTSRSLLHAARLIRKRDELMPMLTEVGYRVELANALWGVYQMIGKLQPRAYVLRKPH